jgi:hypothetical protein
MLRSMALGWLLLLGSGAHAEPRPAYLPGGTTAERPAPAGFQLEREPGRGWVYKHAGFHARISEDGSVRFEDRHGEIHLALPVPLPMPEGTPTLEGTLRQLGNPHAAKRPPRGETPVAQPGMSPYRPAPFDWCRYPNPCYYTASVMMITAAGSFDLTDEILRLRHKDPYRNQKASFLASTLAFRQELSQRASARSRARALDELRSRLEVIDEDRRLTPAARRAAYQAMADELDPDPAIAGPARAIIDERLARGR